MVRRALSKGDFLCLGSEYSRIKGTLASQIPPEDCAQLALGYQNPGTIDLMACKNIEQEGRLVVPNVGEMLYRVQ